jgi:hypothetical protein
VPREGEFGCHTLLNGRSDPSVTKCPPGAAPR